MAIAEAQTLTSAPSLITSTETEFVINSDSADTLTMPYVSKIDPASTAKLLPIRAEIAWGNLNLYSFDRNIKFRMSPKELAMSVGIAFIGLPKYLVFAAQTSLTEREINFILERMPEVLPEGYKYNFSTCLSDSNKGIPLTLVGLKQED